MPSLVDCFLTGCLGITLLIACPIGAQPEGTAEWITVNKDYYSQRYVDLDGITPANVSGLKEVCETELNEPAYFNSGMLMVERTIYVDTFRSTYAIDATTCELRWRNDIAFATVWATNFNRGPAYLDGMIFRGTGDGRVMALDAKTGKLVWQTQGADPSRRESFLSAPIAWDGKVFIGIGISDAGTRGRLMAFDARTGKELWRFHTIPIGVEPGAETWHNSDDPQQAADSGRVIRLIPLRAKCSARSPTRFPTMPRRNG
jgi:alcohol dehydrogenase (cytochrome c)